MLVDHLREGTELLLRYPVPLASAVWQWLWTSPLTLQAEPPIQ
jgi:hypothetical protein